MVSTHSRLKAAGEHCPKTADSRAGFNTQPPEGGWGTRDMIRAQVVVSTHSRLKAAGTDLITHVAPYAVSTHSRLKAAGQSGERDTSRQTGFNTQPPEGGWGLVEGKDHGVNRFQHTAA